MLYAVFQENDIVEYMEPRAGTYSFRLCQGRQSTSTSLPYAIQTQLLVALSAFSIYEPSATAYLSIAALDRSNRTIDRQVPRRGY